MQSHPSSLTRWDSVRGMRWERLFAELEAQSEDLELQERDALVDELRDGDWAETSWWSLLGGRVVVDVLGHGNLDGHVVLANERLTQIRGEGLDHVVNNAAVLAVVSYERRAEEVSAVTGALGWGHVFRTLRDVGESVRIRRVDGSTIDGVVVVVGRDFVRIRAESGRAQSIPFASIAVVSGRA